MNKQSLRLLVGGALATSLAAPALAQQTTDEPAETVIVTGSRIARTSDFSNPNPVDVINRDSIDKSGFANLQQLMEKLPSNGSGAFATRGNNQDSTANGAASISLRGLGADATLVLVNGRRVAISSFAENVTTNFVDINSIPVAAIERVEVLKDGSSAVYGSDAVAGVVNIILRRDFDGLETAFSYGSADGYDETNVSAIWGMSGEDSNVTMVLDYFKNSNLFNTERGSIGSADQSALGGNDTRSSRGYPGNFAIQHPPRPNPTPPPAEITQTLRIDPSCPADRVSGQTCFYDYGPWNLLIPEAERTGVMLLGRQ